MSLIYSVKARETIEDISPAKGFSDVYIPLSGVNPLYALIQAIDGDVRICVDGTIPEADKGFRLTQDSTIEVWGPALMDFLAIDELGIAGTAKLEVVYMGVGGQC